MKVGERRLYQGPNVHREGFTAEDDRLPIASSSPGGRNLEGKIDASEFKTGWKLLSDDGMDERSLRQAELELDY
jgi:hypothetical protein